MGELLFCNEPIASMPYFIEGIALNVYSLEELSFYILQNTYLIERNFMSEELCGWVENDLKRPQFAKELRDIIEKQQTLSDFVKKLLSDCGYATTQEIAEVCQVLSEMENKSEFECKKVRSDRLMENKKYLSSIYGYKQLLESEEARDEDPVVRGNIWHNLGCAYAKLFLFEDAEKCFEKAYALNGNRESLKERMFCFRCLRDEEGFIRAAMDYRLTDGQVEEIQGEIRRYSRSQEIANFEAHLEDLAEADHMSAILEIVQQWKEDYRSICRI